MSNATVTVNAKLQGCGGPTTVEFRRHSKPFQNGILEVATWFGGLEYTGTARKPHTLEELNSVREVNFSENDGLSLLVRVGGEEIRLRTSDWNKYVRITTNPIGDHAPQKVVVKTESNVLIEIPKNTCVDVVLGPCTFLRDPCEEDPQAAFIRDTMCGPIFGDLTSNIETCVLNSMGKYRMGIEVGSSMVLDENIIFGNNPRSFYIVLKVMVVKSMYMITMHTNKCFPKPGPLSKPVHIG
jgi:hypothetical protein